MELQPIGSITGLSELTKKNIEQVIAKTIGRVVDGDLSAIDALVYARKAKELFEALEKEIRPFAEESFHLGKGEKHVMHSVEITEGETGVKYDYATCGDPTWNELNQQLTQLEADMKVREAFLKVLSGPIDIVGKDFEVITIKPPVKRSKMGLKLSLK